MTSMEQLEATVESLGLKAVQARLTNLLEQAAKQEPSYAEFLLDTLKSRSRCPARHRAPSRPMGLFR